MRPTIEASSPCWPFQNHWMVTAPPVRSFKPFCQILKTCPQVESPGASVPNFKVTPSARAGVLAAITTANTANIANILRTIQSLLHVTSEDRKYTLPCGVDDQTPRLIHLGFIWTYRNRSPFRAVSRGIASLDAWRWRSSGAGSDRGRRR